MSEHTQYSKILLERRLTRVCCVAVVLLLGACSQNLDKIVAQEPSDDTACATDGMILKDFPGPKAQIQYVEGKPDFFCDLIELFAVTLVPEQKRHVGGVFVQDMGKADWDHPSGNWIAAKTAIYVVGSKKTGSMGPTFGSFASTQDAEAFAKKEGGKLFRYDQITSDMVNVGGGTMHDSAMSH